MVKPVALHDSRTLPFRRSPIPAVNVARVTELIITRDRLFS